MIFERVTSSFDDVSLSPEEEIELNKNMSKVMAEIEKNTKPEFCYICGKKVTSFCNSHTIPRYCLDSIGENGLLVGPNAIYRLPTMGLSSRKPHQGINEAGRFKLICNDCDNTCFQDYENPDNYILGKKPTRNMLAQIAMKNYLKYIQKKRREIMLETNILSYQAQNNEQRKKQRDAISKLPILLMDLDAYHSDFKKAKEYVLTQKGKGYRLLYYTLLDYVTPLSVQAPILMSIDLEGGIVNDVFSRNANLKLSDIHVCILPQKEKTAVILFVEEGCTVYRKFKRQLLSLPEASRLGLINYLVFLYTDDYYIAKGLEKKIDLRQFLDVADTLPIIRATFQIADTKVLREKYILSRWSRIPNLLDSEYKVR